MPPPHWSFAAPQNLFGTLMKASAAANALPTGDEYKFNASSAPAFAQVSSDSTPQVLTPLLARPPSGKARPS